MAHKINFTAAPFFLDDEDIRWVQDTFASMTKDEKVGQLFCLSMAVDDTEALRTIVKTYSPGGFMFRPDSAKAIWEGSRVLREQTRIPLLLAANLESGGIGLTNEGLYFGRNIEVAATDEDTQAYRLGYVCAKQAGAFGANWAFAPVIDIDYNWRNPITNSRTFGNDPERVTRMGVAFMRGVQAADTGMAVCIKHFPGDGVDERDQHLLASVNSFSADEWRSTFGRLYQDLIDQNAETLMVGHILQPAMTRELCPGIEDRDILPASMNKYLVTDLVRKQMNFQGLIVTDSTNMVGYNAMMSRRDALVMSINSGIDMLLFCKNIDEDYRAITDAVDSGAISSERLDEAVLRSLALKAHMKLHRQEIGSYEQAAQILGCQEFREWASECADKAITLVKDNQGLLPIHPEKTRRIRLTVLGENGNTGSFGDGGEISGLLKAELEAAGFEVSLYDYETLENREIISDGVEAMKDKFDLSIVAANIPTGSNYTTRRLDWVPLLAANCPWYMKDIPTMFISFCNPHHMADVPHISTFINAYTANEFCIRACVEKLTGKSEFKGINPTDVWCGDTWGARVY